MWERGAQKKPGASPGEKGSLFLMIWTLVGARLYAFETTDIHSANHTGPTEEGQLCPCHLRNVGNTDLQRKLISHLSHPRPFPPNHVHILPSLWAFPHSHMVSDTTVFSMGLACLPVNCLIDYNAGSSVVARRGQRLPSFLWSAGHSIEAEGTGLR
jgi:hypothetical protein